MSPTAAAVTKTRTERLFAALELPQHVVSDLAEVVADLNIARRGSTTRPATAARRTSSPARVVRSANWHLTLAFLGEVPVGRVGQAAEALGEAALSCAPLQLSVSGGGRFGRGRYSVVYAGLDGDVARLVQLVHRIRAGLTAVDLPVDQKQYRPHVTLARPGDRVTNQQAAEDLLTLRRYHGPSWTAGEIVLYRSDLAGRTGQAPVHTPVSTLPLRDS